MLPGKRVYRVTHYDPDTWIFAKIEQDFRNLREAKIFVKDMLKMYPFKDYQAFIKIERVYLVTQRDNVAKLKTKVKSV